MRSIDVTAMEELAAEYLDVKKACAAADAKWGSHYRELATLDQLFIAV